MKAQPRNNKGRPGKLYALIGVAVVVIGVGVVFAGRSAPKQDSFPVDPNLPQPQAEGYLLGDPDAPVQLLQWADFECEGCMTFATITEPDIRTRLVETGQISFRYFFFPLTDIHPATAAASYAAACAADQNRFWEMHDAIYAGFYDWAQGRARNPKGVFEQYAERIGIDVALWDECYESDKHRATITAHKAEGLRRGVNGTPTFFINDERANAATYDELKAHVDAAAARAGVASPAPSAAPGDSVVPADSAVP